MPKESLKPTLPSLSLTDKVEGKEPELKLPPPPEPPEYYPGYKTEVESYGKSVYQADKRVKSAYSALVKTQERGSSSSFMASLKVGLAGIFPPLGLYHAFHRPLVPEEYDKALAEAQAELDAGTVELQSAEWRLQVLHTLPAYLSSRRYTVKDSDDILALIPNDTITDSDRQWLQSALGKLGYLENSLPADFEGTVDEVQQKILDEILAEPKLEFKAVHNLTVEELMRSFQPYAIELPEGLSVEDVRSVMSQQGLEDEAAEKELSDYLLERANQWAIETDRLNLVRAGLLQAESPSLTPMEFVKLLFVQPLMAGIELLDKYFNILPRPLASAAIIGVHNLFKTPDDTMAGRMSSLYQYYRSMGESDWSAYAKALNEVDVPWYVRIGVEVVFDPTSYIGLGIATAAASKIGSALSRVGLGFIGARIGPFVGSIENGFIRGADAAFQVGKEIVLSPVKGSFWLAGAGYQIPKTMTMMSRNFARQSSMNFKAVLDRTYPNVRNLQGLTAKDIRETAEACVDAALTRPSEGYDLMVKTGAELMEFDYLDASVAKKLIKGIADDAMELDTVRLARINDDVLNMFSGQSPQITAGNILTKLGLEHTDNTVSTLLSRISSIKDDIVDGALNAFKSDSPVDQLIGMFNHLEAVRYSNLANPISAHMTQAGQAVSWVSRVSDRVMTSMQLVWLERKVIMPFARWNLLFANFGPFNFLENMQRSFLGGAEIMYPRAYGGVAETNRLFRGLTNAPYELQMAERGINRMEMALIDPKTGSTSTFHGGKIPFVTRGVRVGGVDIGKTINIRGIDHKITDFQAYNDMWEYLTTVQRSYDYQVHYMKALPEVAPVEMRQITEAVIGRRNQLKSISKFSASDVRDIERTILQDATVGPDEVLFHSKIDSLEFERRQISKELGKTFDKCTDVRSATKVGIRDEVLDGSIFSDVDGRVAAYVEAERELNIASLVNQTDALQKEAADFAINPPKNLDEFLGDMDNITAMQDAIGERIHDYRRLTELRSHKLKPGKEVDDFHTGSNKLLGEFMEQSQEQLDNIVANMQKFSKELPVGFKMTEPQQAVVDSLADIYRLETRNILSTRSRLAEIEAKIPRTPPKSRDTRFWQQQRAEKAFIWDEHEVNARRLRNLRWNNSRYFLNSIGKPSFVPDVIPPVVGELTPSHVAYLFGVTGDDVYRGLTRMHHHATIRPREDFIDYVKNQANAYAMKSQKTAADIGFTDEAIGEVYDQLWRNLGLDPMALAPDSPTVMQMEEIRQELTRLNVAVRMDETDIAKWRQYVQGVSDDLREMPMYKAAARVIPVTPEVTPTAIPKKVATADWLAKKESAMAKARTQHELAYPTYDDANIIDETMRAIFPFWCTPEDTKILTKVGWKLHTELSLGEDVLTVNPKTLTTEWQPVQEIAVFDYDDELMVIPAKGKDIKFTPNHRWLVVNKWSGKAKIKRGYELKEVSDFIPRALPHRFSEESVLSPRLAAILGWIVTEGYLQSPATQRPFFLIYQHRKNYVSEIEAATGSKAYPRSKENDPDNMVIRVSATDTAEILKVYSGKEDLPKLVSNISKESAQAMWKAMMLAEGSFGQAYNGTAVDEWSQLPGPVSDAFQMLSVLLGKAITVGKHNGTLDKVYFSNNRQPYQVKQCRRMRKEHYTGKVWCPVTANGTWFANFNGSIIPTGNTYEAFRWKWIPRTMMRTPGTMTGLARYMDYCVPTSYKAMTRDGWRDCYELEVGDDILVCNPETLESYWSPVKAVNVFPTMRRDMISLPKRGGSILCTQEHSWLVRNKSGELSVRRAKDITEQYYSIPTTTEYNFPEVSVLSPKDASILGWLVTDGSLNQGIIYQKKARFAFDIEVELGIVPSYIKSNGVLEFFVPKDSLRRLLAICPDVYHLPSVVSMLSKESAESMWNSMMSAEGNSKGRLEFRSFAQKPGPILDAFSMLSVMLGYKVSIEHTDGSRPCSLVHIWKDKNDKPWRRTSIVQNDGCVWCPTVETGVWVVDANGQILPTGNTDGGYIPLPGTDLQLNPLRGSIWMGGLRRFYLRDFPEYYDTFPGMEFIDYIGRAGFYPGIHVMGPIVAFGAATGKPELSEVAPTWVKTGLSALRALSPEHIGKVLDVVYPDRFRDFQTMLTLGEEGYDADEIWRKKKQGFALTEEEEKLWLRAEARANGLKGILMEQTGIFRIRPAEYERVRREMRLAIEEATGVPVATQERIDRLFPVTGKRFSDYYKLDVLQQKLLYGFEAYRRWQGITTPLYPSSWQLLEVRIRDYYEELEKNSHQARLEGVYEDGKLVRPSIVDLNQQLVSGEIGPDQWRSMRSEIQSSLAEVGRALGESPAYKGVPKTLEEREAWLQEKGIPLPTYGADQELLWYYYELEPEYQYNWESGRDELDFETYYAKVDILLESLDDAHRQRLLDRIQLDWTPMERLYWTVSREFFRPYRNIRSIVLEQYTEEQKQQIRRFEVARGEEREALKEIIGPDGNKLISGFNTNVRKARQSLRYVDPELDAWLYFFGTTDTFITETGKENYERYKKQYLTQSMVQ